jgi:AcrR family transcriptional regulator
MVRKAGRPKAGQELLNQERILTAALHLVDAHGVEALSMRRLAAALGVDPMAIYRHLPDKRAVLAGVVRMVFAEFRVPNLPGESWQPRVRAFAAAYRALARAHPNLIFYVVTDVESGIDAVLAANEVLYGALADAGLAPPAVVRTADLVVDFLNGFALAESSGRLGQPGERQALQARLDDLPTGQYPTLRTIFAALTEADLAGDFEAELDIILAGIEALLHNQSG